MQESEKMKKKIQRFEIEGKINKKEIEMESSKILKENKSKEEIYEFLVDSHGRDDEIYSLNRALSKTRKIMIGASLFGFVLLLLLILLLFKYNNCNSGSADNDQ